MDRGETPEECLVRELKEELDLSDCIVDHKLGEYLSHKEGKKDTVHIFVIKLQNKNFTKQWELEDAKWFSFNSLPENLSPATSRRIQEFLTGKQNIVSSW